MAAAAVVPRVREDEPPALCGILGHVLLCCAYGADNRGQENVDGSRFGFPELGRGFAALAEGGMEMAAPERIFTFLTAVIASPLLTAHCMAASGQMWLRPLEGVLRTAERWRWDVEIFKWAHPPLRGTEYSSTNIAVAGFPGCWPQQAAVAMACSCHARGKYLWLTPTRRVTSATPTTAGPTPSPARDFPISRGCEGGGPIRATVLGPEFSAN